MPPKGYRLSQEERLKVSRRTREAMSCPEVRERLSAACRNPDRISRLSAFHKVDAHRPERLAVSIANLPPPKRGGLNPNWKGRQYISCAFCGRESPVPPCREKTARYCSRHCKNRAQPRLGEANPNWRGGCSKACEYCGTLFWVSPYAAKARHCCSRSCSVKAQGVLKRLNNDREFQRKRFKATIKHPNKQEAKLRGMLDYHFPGHWKFAGDGEVILGSCSPDFINVNGQKKVIELFGCWYHGCPTHRKARHVPWHQSETGRQAIFARYGFTTLVIWEHELSDEASLIQKVLEFTEK